MTKTEMNSESNEIIFLDDNDISINLSKYAHKIYFRIYNDNSDQTIATLVSRQKLKELADFIYKYLERE